jgi:HK97 family phage major capsid protein
MATLVKDLKKSIADKRSELRTLLEKGGSDEPISDEDDATATSLEKLITELCARVARMESIRDEAASKATDADPDKEDDDDDEDKRKQWDKGMTKAYDSDEHIKQSLRAEGKSTTALTTVIKHGRAKNEPLGTKMARFFIGAGLSKKANSKDYGVNYVRYELEDREVAKALNTLVVTAGGAFIPQEFLAEYIELLYAELAVMKTNIRRIPSSTGNLTIPRLDSGATSYWQGELDEFIISQQTMDDVQMNARKLTTLVPVTNDLIRRSPISVEALVRADMIRISALTMDQSLLTGLGTSGTTLGLINLSTNTVVPYTGTTAPTSNQVALGNVQQTLMSMKGALQKHNIPLAGAAWITTVDASNYLECITDGVGRPFYADEINKNMLLGMPFYTTNNMPSNMTVGSNHDGSYLILFQPQDQILMETLDVFADSSTEASYNDSGTMKSAYDRDQTVFRLIQEVDFNTRHPQSIAVATVEWFPIGSTPQGGAPYIVQSPGTTGSSAGSTQPG